MSSPDLYDYYISSSDSDTPPTTPSPNEQQQAADNKEMPRPSQYVQTELIKFMLARRERLFKSLLSAKSGFFARKLSTAWENNNHDIYLDEEDPDAFAALVDWMYLQKFTTINATVGTEVCQVVTIYKLADFLVMTKAKNDLVDTFIQQMKQEKRTLHLPALHAVWELDARETPFFKLVLASSIRHFMEWPNKDDITHELCNQSDLMVIVLQTSAEWNKKRWGMVETHDKFIQTTWYSTPPGHNIPCMRVSTKGNGY